MIEPCWTKIEPSQFEELILHLVQAMGFTAAERISGSGDRGHDVVAFEPAMHAAIRPGNNRWVFQCKKSKKLTKSDILRELANFATVKIDTWVLVTTAVPSPELRRWFEGLESSIKFPFRLQAWWRDEVDGFVRQFHRELGRLASPSLTKALGINYVSGGPTAEFDRLLRRCTDITSARIDRFARGKYIPELYVRRALTDELECFHELELTTVNRLRWKTREVAGAFTMLTSTCLRAFPMTSMAEYRTASRRDNSNDLLDEKGWTIPSAFCRDLDKQKRAATEAALDHLNGLFKESKGWLDTLASMARELSEQARNLPNAFYDNQQTSTIITSALNTLARKLGQMPVIELKSSSGKITKEGLVEEAQLNALDRRLTLLSSLYRDSRKQLSVVIDRAGGGKTNLLCHLALRHGNAQPTVLLFGKEQINDDRGLIGVIEREVLDRIDGKAGGLVSLDEVLSANGAFLHVFVDGINETRDIASLDRQIANLLAWMKGHRIKVTLTCRDIYWAFFNYDQWAFEAQSIFSDRLREFSEIEYSTAIQLYLNHYRIDCTLDDRARAACRHPLLLRFFCEAYGHATEVAKLGYIRDIRLKQLFDVYFQRKLNQIALAIGHRNADSIGIYVAKLSGHLFSARSSAFITTQVEEITGESDVSTPKSLYLRLLDEDIIIEEQPTSDIDLRRVTFVYEEFMEYLVARSILIQPDRFGAKTLLEVFAMLHEASSSWVNARGVAEYIALMTLAGDQGYQRADGLAFLSRMAHKEEATWLQAFWSVVGKCSESDLQPDLFDLFWDAGKALNQPSVVKKCLEAMSRYSEPASQQLAGVLLWSIAMPRVMTWSELFRLSSMQKKELTALRERLIDLARMGRRFEVEDEFRFSLLLKSIRGFLDAHTQSRIDSDKRTPAKLPPSGGRVPLIRFTCRALPQYGALIIGGLLLDDSVIRGYCADRLRFLDAYRKEVLFLVEGIIEFETNDEVSRAIRRSCESLRGDPGNIADE
jgi:hypothetical protein